MKTALLLFFGLLFCGVNVGWSQTAPKVTVARANAGTLAALKKNDYASLKRWIASGARNWNAFPADGSKWQTPFRRAVRENDAQSVRLLIARGADVNTRGYQNDSPLHVAALVNADQSARVLLESGAKVNIKDDTGRTPLHSVGLNDKVARLLIAHGADVNARDIEGKTVLHYACGQNAPKIVALLLQSGANANARDANGINPLYMINANQRQNKEQVVALLLKWGANVNNLDNDGETPLFDAVRGSMLGVARLLVQKGAKINVREKTEGATPLHYAAALNYGPQANELLILLLDKGADVNARNSAGETPLHYAAYSDAVEHARTLLERGADIGARDNKNYSALQWAIERKSDDVAALLRARGAQ